MSLMIGTALNGLCAPQQIRLADVRKIYIEKMSNGLDEYLKSAISKKFHSRLQVVLDKSQADAVMASGNDAAQHTQSATITLTDPQKQYVLWSGTAGDRSVKSLSLGVKHGGEAKLAENLAGQLRKAMER